MRSSSWGLLALALACATPPAKTAEPAVPAPVPAPPSSGEAVCTTDTPTPTASGVDAVKDEIVKRMNARDAKGIFGMFGPAMQEAVNQDKTELIVNGIANDNGKIVRATRVAGVGNERHGVYTVEFEKSAKLVLDLTVADDGKILGLRISEPPAPDPAVVKSTLPLGLPFRGQWLVFWGGDTLAVNQHVTHKSQRRAADLLKVGPDGKTHAGDGKKNSDYLAYGQDILAAADGTVETVIDGVPENEPGKLNPYFATGNTVLLRHADGTFSVYAHLQPGKLRVKRGQAVKRGNVLGLCGNSGNSSEPHLHFQLQDGAKFEASFGVEAVFDKVTVERDGKKEDRSSYTFLKGDRIGK